MVRALDLSLVVPGSALHPIAHCFVLGCPKFNSQAVLCCAGTVAVRTAQETRMFGRIGEARGTTVFGIKRENVFHQLVDISDNLPIDWMHCVYKGILKRQLFKWWFNPQYATDSNSLLGISHELENMFLSIKVPHDFTRKP